MTYTGKVKPGSPAVHELTDLTITKASVGPMDNNAYLLTCRRNGDTLLIDAAEEADVLLALLPDGKLGQVLTTHRHGDHWGALAAVVDATGATTLAGTDDASAIPVRTDRQVQDGDAVQVGDCTLHVVSLVGHTPGSVALWYDDPHGAVHLWTGDALFPGGVGKTGSKQDFESLLNDVENKIFARLPDETWVYPGHGDDTTLGDERPHLEEWRARGW
jgi:glyoxylase-like metal-dependent hydrolase (beta-lactamase superfamily II)